LGRRKSEIYYGGGKHSQNKKTEKKSIGVGQQKFQQIINWEKGKIPLNRKTVIEEDNKTWGSRERR